MKHLVLLVVLVLVGGCVVPAQQTVVTYVEVAPGVWTQQTTYYPAGVEYYPSGSGYAPMVSARVVVPAPVYWPGYRGGGGRPGPTYLSGGNYYSGGGNHGGGGNYGGGGHGGGGGRGR